ncbi:MAG: UPF0149 family protein [Methylococcaceae bacterium]|nr:UPF0149 family protein [Methylococcaceae bacterium]
MIDNKTLDKLVSELNKCVPVDQHLNKDGLCGLFYALAITPAIIEPADWMAELFYGERPALTGKQAKDLKKAVVAVVKSSNKLLLAGKLKFPFDFSALDDATLDRIWHWCYGFLQGLRLRLPFWQSGIIANETAQAVDVVRSSVNIFTALIEEDVTVLDNLDKLKAQLLAAGKEPSDELIFAGLLQTLPEAYECIRLFAANMSERLIAQRQAACA